VIQIKLICRNATRDMCSESHEYIEFFNSQNFLLVTYDNNDWHINTNFSHILFETT
jgi:hypothetical protein